MLYLTMQNSPEEKSDALQCDMPMHMNNTMMFQGAVPSLTITHFYNASPTVVRLGGRRGILEGLIASYGLKITKHLSLKLICAHCVSCKYFSVKKQTKKLVF